MRTFTNIAQVTIVKHAFVSYKILMTTLFVFGIIRVAIGIVSGDYNNASFGAY
jgi:hypothetical protein